MGESDAFARKELNYWRFWAYLNAAHRPVR
jgi:hypothetical protein